MDQIPELGQILKNCRETMDLTQLQVMKLTDIHHKTLSGYENNVSQPDLQTLATLCRLYSLSLDEVLNLKPRSFMLSAKEQQLLVSFRRMDSDEQAAVLLLMSSHTKSGKR